MKKVLIVDDQRNFAKKLISKIEVAGYSVSHANNGKSGIQKATTEIPDLVIIDIQIPGYDGYRVAEKIRKHSSITNVPIIFMSSCIDNEAELTRVIELGGIDFFSKPFNLNLVVNKACEILK